VLTDKDRSICAEMVRREFNVELGTRECNDAIGRPQADQYGNDLGTYWVDQIEYLVNNPRSQSGFAYWLCSNDCRYKYRGLPPDLIPA